MTVVNIYMYILVVSFHFMPSTYWPTLVLLYVLSPNLLMSRLGDICVVLATSAKRVKVLKSLVVSLSRTLYLHMLIAYTH